MLKWTSVSLRGLGEWNSVEVDFTWSWSSSCETSLPQACAILFPATRFPTIMEAGPTSETAEKAGHVMCKTENQHPSTHAQDSPVPGCFCLGLGRLVTQVWGHMRTLQGCRAPSRKRCLVSEMWMPPRGALGSVLAGTRARQYTPTWWMLSMAWQWNRKCVWVCMLFCGH